MITASSSRGHSSPAAKLSDLCAAEKPLRLGEVTLAQSVRRSSDSLTTALDQLKDNADVSDKKKKRVLESGEIYLSELKTLDHELQAYGEEVLHFGAQDNNDLHKRVEGVNAFSQALTSALQGDLTPVQCRMLDASCSLLAQKNQAVGQFMTAASVGCLLLGGVIASGGILANALVVADKENAPYVVGAETLGGSIAVVGLAAIVVVGICDTIKEHSQAKLVIGNQEHMGVFSEERRQLEALNEHIIRMGSEENSVFITLS